MDNKMKFSGLASSYAVGRPSYAKEFIDYLYQNKGFSSDCIIADIGSGTGKLTEDLLKRGSFVYGVEPNFDMRYKAIELLSKYNRFYSIDGSGENTTLEDKSVDFITVAQAFHWFDVLSFKKECLRILKDEGYVFLIWNMRDIDDTVNKASIKVFKKYCPLFKGFGGGVEKDDLRIKTFFNNQYEYLEFDHPLYYDKETFIQRCLSSSYSLKPDNEIYEEYVEELASIFDSCQKDNLVMIGNKTVVYFGKIESRDMNEV